MNKEWSIFSITCQFDKVIECEIGEGVNDYGDGPARIVGTFKSKEDAEEICRLHNESIKENA